MPNPDFVYRPPLSPYLDIIYQDDAMVVLNKPSGLLSVPGKAAEHKDCLISRVQRVYPTATVVHRLDMATSGLMVMALTKPAHRHISKQFEKRETRKTYLARVYGEVHKASGEIDLPLICDWPNRPKQMVDFERGKPALTRYDVLNIADGITTIALYPVTGRSHQLRVHMLSLGHPILGDRLYAHPEALALAPRLQLHAQSLSLRHPESETLLTFETDSPF